MKKLLILLSLSVALLLTGAPLVVNAQAPTSPSTSSSDSTTVDLNNINGKICSNASGSSTLCQQNNENRIYGSNGLIIKGANIIGIAGGVAAVIIIMIGGFLFIISGGDANRVNTARNAIIYAVIGLVVIISARVIIGFIISKL